MRTLLSPALGVLLLVAGACSRPNPDFCCVTAESCAAAGLAGELRPCEVGQACRAYECIAAECASSADCTSPDAPTCFNGLCAAGCSSDDDCAGVAGQPRCDLSDGACVGCTADAQCPADRAFCDVASRACRGCTADEQCASGVCIEATGQCADAGAIVYVAEGGMDAGTCPEAAPCRTMAYALGLTSAVRNVIRVLDATHYLGSGVVYMSSGLVIDGNHTLLISDAAPAISVIGIAILEGVRMSSTDMQRSLLDVSSGGSLQVIDARLSLGTAKVSAGASLELRHTHLEDVSLECRQGGMLGMVSSSLERGLLDSHCELELRASRLVSSGGQLPSIRLMGQHQRVENNVFLGEDSQTPLIWLVASPHSRFHYNTVVSSSLVTGSGYALWCEEGALVTSNIFAYRSTTPLTCAARHSLFDEPGSQEAMRGEGNRAAPVQTFFRDRQAGDFHLRPDSPARGMGEPGLVTSDLDGRLRPLPAGSLPDVGAYEEP